VAVPSAGGVAAARTLKTFPLSTNIKPDPAPTIVVSNRRRVVFDIGINAPFGTFVCEKTTIEVNVFAEEPDSRQ
jgi:hypothetical protein